MTTSLTNDRLLRALTQQPVDRTPVWIMRQAGRYLPEYREIRRQAGDFLTLCKTPELACEVTLQPLDRFPLDAAIIFSDILTIPDAMGLGLYFAEGEGPRFSTHCDSWQSIEQLPVPDPNIELRYVTDAIATVKQALNGRVPLIGFAGSPWTVACYMVEGGSSKTFSTIKRMMYSEPQLLHLLLTKLTEATTLYLQAQIAAGADAIMLFDTWGGILSDGYYQQFSLQYMQQIIANLRPEIPSILFTKNGSQWLEDIASTGCHGIGLDWTYSLNKARKRVGGKVTLQGNLDPSILLSNPEIIEHEVKRCLADFGHGSGHIFNLGHGITPNVPPEHLACLIEAVQQYSPSYHDHR